jgi:hypothetical protein
MTGRLLLRGAAFLIIALALSSNAWAGAGDPLPTEDGTCSAADFRTAWGGATELPATLDHYQATVLRDGAVLYANPTGSDRLKVLRFNSKVYVRAHDVNRLGVALEGERSVAGWVQRKDLLCNRQPLQSSEHKLERKAVIRTQLASTEEGTQIVRAYETPEMAECQPACRDLTRFRMYFIAGQTNDAFLLAESAVLQSSRGVLVGWVKKEHVFEWPWALALRPAESLRHPDGGPGAICAYLDLSDMRAKRDDKCQPILGGNAWFETEYRLLVRDIREDYYEVIAPVDGFGQVNSAGGGKIAFNPSQLRGTSASDSLFSLNSVDVFFVIDGTQSMKPWLDEIVRGRDGKPGVVATIAETLKAKTAGGVKYRFGYSIYRDSTTDAQSTGVNMTEKDHFLWDGACDAGEDRLAANHANFVKNLAQVKVSTDDPNDDFPENTFGAMAIAINDMAKVCPKNRKIAIVIGDAGYDPEMQRKRGHDPVKTADLVNGFESKGILPFFIRVADDPKMKNNTAYRNAYNAFREQALEIVKTADPKLHYDERRQFFDLMTAEAKDIASNVKLMADSVAQPDAVNEIVIDMRGGASLQEAITRLRATRKDTIPGFFYGLLENQKCKELGDACTRRIYNDVRQLYVSRDEKVDIDVLMRLGQLETWTDIFRPLLENDNNLA